MYTPVFLFKSGIKGAFHGHVFLMKNGHPKVHVHVYQDNMSV